MNQAIMEVLLKQVGINPAELGAMLNNAKNLAEQHVSAINSRLSAIEKTQLNLASLVCELKNTIDGMQKTMRENAGEIIPAGATFGDTGKQCCEYCGPTCLGGAAHNARVEDGAKHGQ